MGLYDEETTLRGSIIEKRTYLINVNKILGTDYYSDRLITVIDLTPRQV